MMLYFCLFELIFKKKQDLCKKRMKKKYWANFQNDIVLFPNLLAL